MDKMMITLQNPIVKVSIIAVAAIIKYYAPDEIDKIIDNALLTFLGYHAMTQNNSTKNG